MIACPQYRLDTTGTKIAPMVCLAGPGGDFGICGGGHIEDYSLLAMIQPRLNLFVGLPGGTVVFQL